LKYLLFFLAFFSSSVAFGQFSIKGKILVSGQSSPGADIVLYKMGSDQSQGTVSDLNGDFILENVVAGNYRLVVNYLGFKKYKKRLTVTENTVLENIELVEDVIEIDGVEITGTMIQAIQKGDTTVFNADAFKTLPDADAKALISKIPGIEIEGGTMKANGEDVQKVTVDGREFFGNDPNVALNALPAEIIQKIEIIDEKSEKSQFTGFDDGNSTKTINIVTKPDRRNGEFGKIYAGYGQEERYQSGGNINFFNGNQRTSLIGLSNNVNQQNFSTDDLLGVVGGSGRSRRGRRGGGRGSNNFLVNQQDGIATTHSAGINFSDKWSEKTSFSGSYFFNNSNTLTQQNIEEEFLSDRQEGDLYLENNDNNSSNTNHRFQGRLDIELNENNSIRYRPRFSWQSNKKDEFADSEFLRSQNGSETATTDYFSLNEGFNITNDVRYQHKFAKRGRTISVGIQHNYRPSDSEGSLSTTLAKDSTSTVTDQSSTSINRNSAFSSEISYSEPINDKSQLAIEYEYEIDNGENDEFTYESLDINSILIDELSNDQSTIEESHSGNIGYRWRKGKSSLYARGAVEFTNISSNQSLPFSTSSDKSYVNFLPFVMLRLNISESSNLRLFYRPRTDNPSANQLSETVNNSNPLQLSKGNVNIEQGYQHSLFARYSSTNKKAGTVFYMFAGADYSGNYIGDRTYLSGRDVDIYESLNLDQRSQLTLPENQSGYLNLRSYVTIGIPVTKIKSKLNFNLSGNFSNIPSIIDDAENDTKNTTVGLGVSLTSNISRNVDFTISTKTNIGNTKNTLLEDFDEQYINQSSGLKLNVIFPYGIVWRNEISHQIFTGYGDDFDDSYLLGIMSIGKKFLKNDRAEISLSVFDLFNQNQAISRNISSISIENVSSNVLQRYFMLNFKYDIRHFGKAPAKSDRKKEWRGRGKF